MPDEAGSGGGLFIATLQLAITLGAVAGGITSDRSGALGAAVMSGMLLLSLPVTPFGLRACAASPDTEAT